MKRQETLEWLATVQAELSEVLRTPLVARGGRLQADDSRYPRTACSRVRTSLTRTAAERLAVYNRQYWFRLLRVMQNELPLTSTLWGLFRFNLSAMRFLLEHPPRERDLARVADGFDGFLEHGLREPNAALLEAARVDMAFRRVFAAPEQLPLQLPAAVPQRARLRFSVGYVRLVESRPLVQLRASLVSGSDEPTIPMPDALPAPQTWALYRTARGVGRLLLEPLQARLLELLETQPLEDALGHLEVECPAPLREALPQHVRAWMASGAHLGFFAGLEAESTPPAG